MSATAEELEQTEERVFPTTPGLRGGLRVLRRNALVCIGASLTLVFVLVGCVGAIVLLVPSLHHLYLAQDLGQAFQPPLSEGHVLGTDNLGRDLAWRVIAGTGISLLIGVGVTAFSIAVGLLLGVIAGYAGGVVDRIISGLIDLSWGFPVILVAVIFAGMVGTGVTAVILAVAIVNWAGFARVVRAETISLREREFVEAARALGGSSRQIVTRHVVPNLIGSTLVMTSYYVAVTIVVEAGFAFIGLGTQPPTPSLGQMVASGREFLALSPWIAIVPGCAIALIVLALNTLGDGLRDVLDPRMRALRGGE